MAALHTQLIKETIFRDFVDFYGEEKFVNRTNGITPRRWLHQANPALSQLITKKLGSSRWLTHLDELDQLKQFADDPSFQAEWSKVKIENKKKLANYIKQNLNIDLDPHALFDVQVKRIHEYKRQLMNVFGVMYRYLLIKKGAKFPKRVVIFGGKAAPGYYIAKLVIRLIHAVATVINNDESIEESLKLVFIPDYNVSLAEIIIPASDISQHISTAGTEASGTSNMKFVLNGGLLLGTYDGANIEIGEETGSENWFCFGARTEQVSDLRHANKYRGVQLSSELEVVFEAMLDGFFGDLSALNPLIDSIINGGDHYLVSFDFPLYIEVQDQVDREYQKTQSWSRKTIIAAASMGKFSSDRCIQEYAKEIWNLKPIKK